MKGRGLKSHPFEKREFNFLKKLQWVFVIFIFVFLGRMVWKDWIQVKKASFSFTSFPFIISTFIFAFSYFIQIWAWYRITLKLEIALSLLETLKSWFYSQLGKYLPGKVWILLSRFTFYELRGKSKKNIAIALYFETITMIMAAFLIFFMTMILFKKIGLFYSGGQLWFLILLVIFAFICLHPRFLQNLLNWILVQFKREPISLFISYSEILWILFICIVAWIVGGIGFYLFVDSIYPVPSTYIVFLTGALAISSTLGFIAVFAPSGLGIREGALIYLLSYIMPEAVAVIIAVLTRIWMTLIEIGLIGVIYLLSKFGKIEKKDSCGQN